MQEHRDAERSVAEGLSVHGVDTGETPRAAVARADADRAAMEAEQAKMIDALRDGLAQLSEGNLTIEIQTPFDGQQDALRSDFNGAVGNLKAALVAVTEHSGLIRGEVAEISSAADDLSRRTEHQAATLEETAAALAEITASVSSAAEGARQANAVVGEARDNAAASGRYDVGTGYSRAVAEAGGLPVLLPHELDRVPDYVARCDGFILTGGVDPDTARNVIGWAT